MKAVTALKLKNRFRFMLPLICIVFGCTMAKADFKTADKMDAHTLEGRWDITIDMAGGKTAPSWLEVRHSGLSTIVGEFVGASGSARPISKINFAEGKWSFTIPPQWETGIDVVVAGELTDENKMNGTILNPDGKMHNWTAVRAPLLNRTNGTAWGRPIKLFNGKDLTGWHAMGPNQWQVVNGVLTNPKSGSNLVTDEKFNDFKLHIEFRIPKGSNSGIYLRGRYEVQVMDSKGVEPVRDQFSAIYGFLTPSVMMAKDAGEWNTYDITLIGRMVTVVANGTTVISNQAIPGITGGALDSNEGEPGPIYIQGDHGAVEYKNIILTPAR